MVSSPTRAGDVAALRPIREGGDVWHRERADEGGREAPAGAVNVTEVRSADVLEVGASRALARERCALVGSAAWLRQAPLSRSPIASGGAGRWATNV